MSSLTACSARIETGTMEGTKTRDVNLPTIRTTDSIKIWDVVNGTKLHGGKQIKFTIQEIPKDRYEDVADHMCTHFVPDEPMCKSINAKDDPNFVADFRAIWMAILKQGLSAVAFTENPDGGKPIIAGVNVLGVDRKGNDTGLDNFEFLSADAKRIFNIVIAMSSDADVYSTYGVDTYMFAFGLSVNPVFRGQALGGYILKAREKIGREYNIPATLTAFTSPASQKLAERAGFEVLIEKDFDQVLNEEGKIAFPNIGSKSIKIMARRLT